MIRTLQKKFVITAMIAITALLLFLLGVIDTSAVHTIDIVMDDWDGFLDTCTNEESRSAPWSSTTSRIKTSGSAQKETLR